MNGFFVFFLVAGMLLSIWGFLIVFSNPFFEWMEANLWKDDSKIMSERAGRNYDRYGRGLRILLLGIVCLGFAVWITLGGG